MWNVNRAESFTIAARMAGATTADVKLVKSSQRSLICRHACRIETWPFPRRLVTGSAAMIP